LASQIQTTVFSTRTASSSDDGVKQSSIFEELIEETLHQEFEMFFISKKLIHVKGTDYLFDSKQG
jgi:hypothetical protein